MKKVIIILMLLLLAGLNANAQTVHQIKLYQDSINYKIEKLNFNSPIITLIVSDSGATLTDSISVSGVFDRQEIPLWGLDENNKIVWKAIPGAGETKAFIFYTYGADKIRLNFANVDTVSGRYTFITLIEHQTAILPNIIPQNISILGGYLDSIRYKVPFSYGYKDSCYFGDSLAYYQPTIRTLYTYIDFISGDTATSGFFTDTMRIDVITSLGDTIYNVDFRLWASTNQADARYSDNNFVLINKTMTKSVLILTASVYAIRVRYTNKVLYALRKVQVRIRGVSY